MPNSGGGIRYGPKWEVRSSNGSSAELWRPNNSTGYRLRVGQHGQAVPTSIELTLTELLGLREWINVEARRRVSEGRG